MKSSRFSEEQIIGILKQALAGMKIVDLCRTHGISDVTFYKWRSKYGGLEISEAKRLRVLDTENNKPKSLTFNWYNKWGKVITNRHQLPVFTTEDHFQHLGVERASIMRG